MSENINVSVCLAMFSTVVYNVNDIFPLYSMKAYRSTITNKNQRRCNLSNLYQEQKTYPGLYFHLIKWAA